MGPEIDVTFAVLNHGECYLSQYIGNTTKYETTRFLEDALKYLMRITGTEEVDAVACDLHPRFFTTRLAEELSREYSAPLFKVQHHHAHATALAVDYGVDELVCIAADGVGYGDDGTAWGGEILYCFDDQYKRLGSLAPRRCQAGTYVPYTLLGCSFRSWEAIMLLITLKNFSRRSTGNISPWRERNRIGEKAIGKGY